MTQTPNEILDALGSGGARLPKRTLLQLALAGFTCGIGPLAMAAVGIALISKSISSLLY